MSDRRYRISKPAESDIDYHFGYIAHDNMDAAIRFFDAIHEACAKLASMPGMGARRDVARSSLQGLRSWPIKGFGNYLIFYRPVGQKIVVVRILHGAQDIDAILEEETGD